MEFGVHVEQMIDHQVNYVPDRASFVRVCSVLSAMVTFDLDNPLFPRNGSGPFFTTVQGFIDLTDELCMFTYF